ncbi:MAG: transporter related protein [Solirubrobacterales bacterium]|nr:transporter related protein [Solirubrobacterales bacterium]
MEGALRVESARSPAGSPGAPSRVTLQAVAHRYLARQGEVAALGRTDLQVNTGEFVTLVGPSGCGKSTLLNLIAGFLVPTEGEVLVDGEVVTGPSPDRGVVFQQANLYPWMSVRDNVALGPRLRGVGKAERRTAADELLALVGLEEFGNARPYELSGGMQQRCQIARVLANDPDVLLLDEPFGALDAITREHLQMQLHRIWLRSRKTAVFITHSVEEAVFLGTRVIVMGARPGRIVFDERPPFRPEARTPELRATPAFVAWRERVSAVLRGT